MRGKVQSTEDLMGTVESEVRVLRKKGLFLLKAQTRETMYSPSPSAIGGVLGSIFSRKVRLLMDPPDVRADFKGPASFPPIQQKVARNLDEPGALLPLSSP